MARHFLTGAELSAAELDELLARASELKAAPHSSQALRERAVGLIFDRPSTRTRVSFEVAVVELGGHPVVMRGDELQLSRGEALRDTALVLSRQLAAVGLRTGPQETVEELARHSEIPIFNMLTALHHPCQTLADLLTLRETFGSLAGLRVAYVGDGNNVARSLALLGAHAGIEVVVASPRATRSTRRTARRSSMTRARPSPARTPSTPTCGSRWATRPARRSAAPTSRATASTTRCSTARARRRSRCTTCRRIRARRSPPRCSTGAPADLGSGGEPPPRAEGAARMAAGVSGAARRVAAPVGRRRARAARRVARLRRRRRRAHRRGLRRVRRRRVPRRPRSRASPSPQARLRAGTGHRAARAGA